MNVGIIHTVGSPCRCAEALEEGLAVLGHKTIIVDSEDIVLNAADIANACDLVIDHSDTFLGRGFLRFFVRSVLESHGAMVVGSNSKACQLADNKIAAKAILAKAGIPVPPGIAVGSVDLDIPSWLKPPFVVKAAFEHMSRGTGLTHNELEAGKMLENIIKQAQQPVMIETYIRGRELAVSVIDGPEGLEVFPPLEWYPTSKNVFLAEEFKL